MAYWDTYQGTLTQKIDNTKVLSASNTSANVNLFKLTGSVKNVKIYGVLTAKTTLANMTSVYFDMYDSTAAVAITKNDGVMSTALVGAVIAKVAAATVTASINLAVTGTIIDAILLGFEATQKNSANTYIRFNYATTDAPIAATMKYFVEYESVNGGYLETV
jgi:hypothetical protein